MGRLDGMDVLIVTPPRVTEGEEARAFLACKRAGAHDAAPTSQNVGGVATEPTEMECVRQLSRTDAKTSAVPHYDALVVMEGGAHAEVLVELAERWGIEVIDFDDLGDVDGPADASA